MWITLLQADFDGTSIEFVQQQLAETREKLRNVEKDKTKLKAALRGTDREVELVMAKKTYQYANYCEVVGKLL